MLFPQALSGNPQLGDAGWKRAVGNASSTTEFPLKVCGDDVRLYGITKQKTTFVVFLQ